MPTISSRTSRRLTLLDAIFASVAIAACAAVCAVPSDANATRSDLTAFLGRAQSMSAHNRAVRADLTITTSDGATSKAVAIIDATGKHLFYAADEGAWRALAPLQWGKTGKVSISKGAKPATFGPDDPLGNTSLRPIEFFPAWSVVDYETAFISDDTRLEKTVMLYAPDEIPYLLFVITFDKEKMVPLIVKYYTGQMNNLVRVQTDSDHVMVGARPRPRKIVISDYENNTKTTFDIEWKLLDSVPEELLNESTFNTATLEQ